MNSGDRAVYQGYEVCLYPLPNVGITAGPDASNHTVIGVTNTGLWDNGWHYTQTDPLYAPFTMEYVAYNASGNTQMFRSVDRVWIPGYSEPQYVTFSVSHSATLYFTTIGTVIPQGTHFYDTGTYGISSGAHVHYCLYIGSRSTIWPTGRNALYGQIFYSPNPPNTIADFFYLTPTDTISSGWGLNWTVYDGTISHTSTLIPILMILKKKKERRSVLIYD